MQPEKPNIPLESPVSRRDFLKNSSLAALGFMIVPRHVLGKGFVAPSDRLMVAAVGAGGMGGGDIAGVFKSGRAEIISMCDVDDRRSVKSRTDFPKATYYKDWRVMLDKEKQIDAVTISTPDHNHAAPALAAMALGKHVYVQKPLTHDIYEAKILTQAAAKYKVVTQMGNQGSSGDGVRLLKEWYDAGVIGDVHTVYCWTDRPVWPQGISWPKAAEAVPAELDWDLWLGTAPFKKYVDGLVPFNWRGWWDYGTGALGDMGCHIAEPAFSVLNLAYAKEVQASVGSVYVDEFVRGYFPESCPPSSHVILKFPKTAKTAGDVKLHWMDGGIQPERPDELAANEIFGDGGNGTLFIGTKGKMMCSTYGANPRLLPVSKTEETKVPQKYARVEGGSSGHYNQWVDACIAGHGKKETSSPFEIAGPLTEALLMANLAIRAHDIQYPNSNGKGFNYPGRNLKLLWDNSQMKVTNFDDVNQFVRRTYREGYSLNL
jgi:predicted dehydrogenase